MAKSHWKATLGAIVGIIGFAAYLGVQGYRIYKNYFDPPPPRIRCVDQLKKIDLGKACWAVEKNKGRDAQPSWEDIADYCLDHGTNGMPKCPDHGRYEIGSIGEWPRCSIGGPEH